MKTYNIKETASRIRDLRKTYHYTQEQAAEWLQIDRRTLSNIETAKKGCSVDMLLRIAEVYDVTLDYLLLGSDLNEENSKIKLNSIIQQLISLRDVL